jgi:hypothetical protein
MTLSEQAELAALALHAQEAIQEAQARLTLLAQALCRLQPDPAPLSPERLQATRAGMEYNG